MAGAIMSKKKLWAIRGAVILMAGVSILIGVAQGEPMEVLQKATNICLQCIGIG